MTKVFFDTEFTGLHQATSLVSIGLITESDERFYAELTDYDKDQIDEWLQKNVIDKLTLGDFRENELRVGKRNRYTFRGTRENVANCLNDWFDQIGKVEMWSDCLSYDWVLFNQIFGHAFSIPKNVYYIPFDLATLFKAKGIDPDISREKYAFGECLQEMKDQKHNALWDARVIKACYEKLTNT